MLPHIKISTGPDLLHAHHLAMQIGEWAGLPAMERLRFAATVAENSDPAEHASELAFSIVEAGDGKKILKAVICNQSGSINREILQIIPNQDLPAFSSMITPQSYAEEECNDMQQSDFALAHDLKNSLTKLKLALSLIEGEEVPDSISNYIQIIHRATKRFEAIALGLNKILRPGQEGT